MSSPSPAPVPLRRNRDWWRAEARQTKTDLSSLLRQRLRVLAWVRAGRPPLSTWIKSEGES